MTDIILKQGTGVPQADDLEVAEIAIDNSTGDLYTKLADLSVKQLNPDGAGGGTGSSVHIGENPPATPAEGQQWMEVPASGDATMWIYDGGKWLQQPGGKDGAPGADGNIADGSQDGIVATWDDTTGQWTPDSSLTIDASGNVGIGTDAPAHALEIASNGTALNDRSVRINSDRAKNVIGFGSSSGAGTNLPNVGVDGTDFVVDNGGATRLTIDSSGNVGIGTTDASASAVGPSTLVVSGSSNAGITVSSPGNNSFLYMGKAGTASVDGAIAYYNNLKQMRFSTDGQERLTIDSSGNATFSGTVSSADLLASKTDGGVVRLVNPGKYAWNMGFNGTSNTLCLHNDGGDSKFALDPYGNATFSGTVNSTNTRSQRVIQDGSPVIDAKGLIKTLTTLRNATKDETTLEGLRDSIGNAIGGLIEEFENQIATMPSEDEA